MNLGRFVSALARRGRQATVAAFAPHRLAVYELPVYDHHQLAFSQEGEDLIIGRMFAGAPPGLFVDVGAHHPQRFSNTYRLYLQGWTGINIDPTPGCMAAFDARRPNDTNLEIGVSEDGIPLTLYCFNEPALNTFDAALASSRDHARGYHLIARREVRTERLDALLERHLPSGARIQLLTIDVEGFEASVLRSNDWSRFRPEVVVVEDFGAVDIQHATESPTGTFLVERDYLLVARTAHSSVFRAQDSVSAR